MEQDPERERERDREKGTEGKEVRDINKLTKRKGKAAKLQFNSFLFVFLKTTQTLFGIFLKAKYMFATPVFISYFGCWSERKQTTNGECRIPKTRASFTY